MKRKLRMGMIGGGKDAFIGAIHRIAANMDGLIEFKAGALSINPEVAVESGRSLFLDENRIYTDFKTMLEAEAQMPENERLDFVSIVTPNFAHFEPAMMAMDKGFHVVIEKPITISLEEAKLLKEKQAQTGKKLLLTHTYTGYPMAKQIKQMVAEGRIGKVRKVWVEYPQGWLSKLSEREAGNAGAAWRTDPKKSGKSGAFGDIGTHAFNLAEYVTGDQVAKLCADLLIQVEGRMLDDDGAVLLRFEKGAAGVIQASQVAAGEENALKIRVYGEKGGLEWAQHEPNTLIVRWLDKPTEIYRAGTGFSEIGSFAKHNSRTPGGHPEGYLEAFGNLYRNFALTLLALQQGEEPTAEMLDFPGVEEGIRGMAFIENVVKSSNSDQKWTPFEV